MEMGKYRLTSLGVASRNPGARDWAISPFDVAEQLFRVARGKTPFALAPAWRFGAGGHVVIDTADGWRIVVFNDGEGVDYVDSATAPDGRHQDDWHSADLFGWFDPCDLLRKRDLDALLKRLCVWRLESPARVAIREGMAPARRTI